MAFRRKGNKVSKSAILDILEKRPHPHTPSIRRTPVKRLSSSQAPPGFHKTLDTVQNEIKQAIERAKTSTVDEQQQQQQQRQQYDGEAIGEQKEDTSNQHQQELTSSPFLDRTLSHTITLAEAIPASSINKDNNHDVVVVDDNSIPSPMEPKPAANNGDNDMMTGLDTAPSDTPFCDFGENVFNALDKIMGGDLVRNKKKERERNV
jgi:hypothetical protein